MGYKKGDTVFHLCWATDQLFLPSCPSHIEKCSVCHTDVWVADFQLMKAPKTAKKICWTCYRLWRESNPKEEMQVINKKSPVAKVAKKLMNEIDKVILKKKGGKHEKRTGVC